MTLLMTLPVTLSVSVNDTVHDNGLYMLRRMSVTGVVMEINYYVVKYLICRAIDC